MNQKELRKLVEKYFNGDSTEEEEVALRSYFTTENAPPEFETEKAIFGYTAKPVEIPEPSPDFESRIMAGIDASEDISRKRYVKFLISYISVAASLLILIASYFFFNNRSSTLDTYSDPRIAYAETMKILYEVSAKLNSGTRALQPVSKISEMRAKSFESINKSTAMIEKNLMTLDYLQQAAEITGMSDNRDK